MTLLRKKDRPAVNALRAHGVQLADAPAATPPAPAADGTETPTAPVVVPKQKWIQVASSGTYSGHGDGDFTLDQAVFSKFVENFHADPRFKAGADGVGSNPVVPFDYEHTSEMDPRMGSIPAGGVPAPAWALDLKVEGDATASSLWCFVDFGDTIREQIAKNEYRFVSIAFTLEATDPNTNADIGALITSIAFTNHPFLRDLQPLAASARRGDAAQRRLDYWGSAAKSPEQGFEYTRSVLQLPAATTPAEVVAEAAKVVAWAGPAGGAPAGVDISDIMCDLRSIWSIPVTATAEEVLGQIQKAALALVPPPAPAAAAAAVAAAASTTEATPLATPTGGTPAAPSALSNTEPAKKTMENLKQIVALFNKSKTGHLLAEDAAAVTEAVAGAVADQTTLSAILTALGVKDGAAALASVAELSGMRAKLQDALSQLDEVLSMQSQLDTQTEAQDVGAAMTAAGLDPANAQVKTAFCAQRNHMLLTAVEAVKADEKTGRKAPKALAEARKEARRGFLAAHGVAESGREQLLTNIVAGPNGTQLTPPTDATPPARKIPLGNGATSINLSAVKGANPFLKLCNWVQAQPGNKDLDWADVCRKAKALQDDSTVDISES